MQVHHSTTTLLCILSYQVGYVKIGLVIMFLMDLADPFLHFSKQLIYLRDGSRNKIAFFGMAADASFLCFTVSFTISRMIAYPVVVLSAFRDNHALLVYGEFTKPFSLIELFENCTKTDKVMLLLLVTLFCLQCIWFAMIIRILVRVAIGLPVEDDRSDSEIEATEKKVK